MRVLVIGGTGLISTPIVEQLVALGHDPILFNRGQTPSRLGRKVESIRGDRNDFPAFAELMAGRSFDAVIDMLTFGPEIAANAVEVFTGKTAQYVFCSTVCVYGRLNTIPAPDHEPHKPISEYGSRKSEAETVFMNANRTGHFPVTILRPAHTYGPGAPLGDVWGRNPGLVPWLRAAKPMVLAGDGTTLWQPTFADDVARAFVLVLGEKAALGEAFNAVGDEIMEWAVYVRRLAEALGHQARPIFLTTEQILAAAPAEKTRGLREIFSIHNAFSNAKFKRVFPEFSGLVPLEEGVRRTVEWMDAAGAHAYDEPPDWMTRLVNKSSAFVHDLAS